MTETVDEPKPVPRRLDQIDWTSWQAVDKATLLFVRRDDELLLPGSLCHVLLWENTAQALHIEESSVFSIHWPWTLVVSEQHRQRRL